MILLVPMAPLSNACMRYAAIIHGKTLLEHVNNIPSEASVCNGGLKSQETRFDNARSPFVDHPPQSLVRLLIDHNMVVGVAGSVFIDNDFALVFSAGVGYRLDVLLIVLLLSHILFRVGHWGVCLAKVQTLLVFDRFRGAVQV